jgi:serine/threonine protein kinase
VSLPSSLGRLRRVDRIGAGGFATVWLYHDDELDSAVAVKALADNWAARADIRDRFLDEARILRRADSDHVVRVYDIGETESGTPYFVMSYADRGTISSRLDEGPIDLDETADLVEQAAAGLQVLHATGVIHRDIKPQNLLLRSNGDDRTRLLVADLGMAKAMLHASGITQVVGTPAYMAPEQATGIGLSPRADMYGLAAVTYRMVTGSVVREGGLAELLDRRVPPAPSSLAPLPAAIDDVLLRALDPDPDERWPDVGSFARAFREASRQPVTEAAPTRGRRPAVAAATTLRPTTAVASAPERRPLLGSPLVVVLLAVLVLAATFAAAYGVTTQLH